MTVNYDLIPEHCRDSVQLYIENGRPLGGFLTAVFSNDLVEAAGRADNTNRQMLPSYAVFLWNYAPQDCWGSASKVRQWITLGGLTGLEAQKLKEGELK